MNDRPPPLLRSLPSLLRTPLPCPLPRKPQVGCRGAAHDICFSHDTTGVPGVASQAARENMSKISRGTVAFSSMQQNAVEQLSQVGFRDQQNARA